MEKQSNESIIGDSGRSAFWRKVKPSQLKFYSVAAASAYVGKIQPGSECFGLSKGQFSLIDLVEHVISEVGPCEMDISTWTAADADAARVIELVKSRDVLKMRWLIDRVVLTRQPKLVGQIIESFTKDAIRLIRTHAKFILLRNDDWKIAIVTSMNLNSNPRFESFQMSTDGSLCEFFTRFVDQVYSQQAKELYIQPSDVPAFDDGTRDLFAEAMMQ